MPRFERPNDYVTKALVIRENAAISKVDIKAMKAEIVQKAFDTIVLIPANDRMNYLRQIGGYTVQLMIAIGPEPDNTRNGLGFIEEEAWYVWDHLRKSIPELRFELQQRICEQDLKNGVQI